jgi:hypothetical protein
MICGRLGRSQLMADVRERRSPVSLAISATASVSRNRHHTLLDAQELDGD